MKDSIIIRGTSRQRGKISNVDWKVLGGRITSGIRGFIIIVWDYGGLDYGYCSLMPLAVPNSLSRRVGSNQLLPPNSVLLLQWGRL